MAENNLIIKLSKPYVFENETYEILDLTGLEEASAADLAAVERIAVGKNPAANPATLEMTRDFAFALAARMSKKKLEFFNGLPAKDGVKIKTAVVGFLYAEDGTS